MSDFQVTVKEVDSVVVIATDGYLNNIGGEKISEVCDEYMEKGKNTFLINLEKSSYLLVRQDPPFNMNYITNTYFLDRLKGVKIINNPTSIRNVSEKLYSYEFKKYMPPTIFTSRNSDIISFIKQNKLSVMKPINGHGGNNIKLLKGRINKTFLNIK